MSEFYFLIAFNFSLQAKLYLISTFLIDNFNIKMNCDHCKNQRQPKSKGVRKYQYERVIMLRYGCLCNANRTYWKLNKIAEALGLPLMTVSDICKRFRRENCQIQRIDLRVNNGPRFKLSREQIRTVTNIHMLQHQYTYPLDERVHDLAANFNIHISRCTLRSYYLRNGIKFQSVNLHNTNKLTRELVIRQQQIEYCRLIRQARDADRYIFYLDESSISTWNPLFKKTYSCGRVLLSYPGYRGHNLTIIGAIGGNRDRNHLVWSYKIVPRTNT